MELFMLLSHSVFTRLHGMYIKVRFESFFYVRGHDQHLTLRLRELRISIQAGLAMNPSACLLPLIG